MKNKDAIIEKLNSIIEKIDENSLDAWEDNLEGTKSVVILEDFSKNCNSEDPELEFTYNGWKEELEELKKMIADLM